MLLSNCNQLLSVGALRKELVLRSTPEREGAPADIAGGPLHAYPLFRSPAASPLIVKWIPVTTSSAVSPVR